MPETVSHKHECQAIVVSCMDHRLRSFLRKWTIANISEGFDRVAIAGGVKNLPFVVEQIDLSVKLHNIKEAYLINHGDCGAYGAEGTFEKNKEDLLFAKKILQHKFPRLKIILFYLKLNGEFVKIL
ncbi:hypothetical protein M1271_02455 [Patescibacteria group bacterium]|nr:hypothetical protein [Patescibacteria group bacterium]MCL5797650.1 hypothetical protein [Patescibacteria group bacterium]